MDLEQFKKIRNDPIEFLKCVKTLDQVDKKNPIKHFPIHLDYIKLYVRIWQNERLIVVPKSRRMKMTWTNVALYLWDTMFNIGRHNAIVSKKEDDAADLIKRAEFIYDHLDENLFPKSALPRKVPKFGILDFPELNSRLEGFPQGADQLRQFTFSGILADEMAFWEKAQDMYASAFPTLEGGGRFTAISSPGPGFFKRLVHDQLDVGND